MTEKNIPGKIKRVDGDGACLFNSVLEVLGINTRHNALILRKLVVNYE